MTAEQTHGNEAIATFLSNNIVERMDYVADEIRGQMLYVEHKLVHLLFPEHFIDVTSVQMKPNTGENVTDRNKWIRYLYSNKARIPRGHSIFTHHSKTGLESNLCDCTQCSSHLSLHTSPEFQQDLSNAVSKVAQAGIGVPVDDPTDYCIGPGGIIFFEIDSLDPIIMDHYLINQGITHRTVEAGKLFVDYTRLCLRWDSSKPSHNDFFSTP